MGVSQCCSIPFNEGHNEPPLELKSGFRSTPQSLMTHPLDRLEGAGMCKITGPAHSGCVCASVAALTQSVPTRWPQREARHTLLPLIIQRAHSFPLRSHLFCCRLKEGFFNIFPTFISLLHTSTVSQSHLLRSERPFRLLCLLLQLPRKY